MTNPSSQRLRFAESLHLNPIPSRPDTFTNAHEPWTWPHTHTIPGGVLMSQCALAAAHTVPEDFTVSSLHAHFLGAASAKRPLLYQVTRLSDGGRYVTRTVTLTQAADRRRTMLHVSVTFVRDSPWTGAAMTHTTARRTTHHVDEITMDDHARGRGPLGSFMQSQRFPVTFVGADPDPGDISSGIATCVGRIDPITGTDDTFQTHVLGMINLSDYHVMDAPLQLNGITFGLPRVGDKDGPRTEVQTKVNTTVSHSVYFTGLKGWRADELTYIEVGSSWAKDGRAMVESKMFSKGGELIATCVQEGFYVFKKGVKL